MILLLASGSFAQYWQQKVDFTIDVTLDAKEKTIDGFEKLTYYNNSPDTLNYIWFHLWPNAYKNDRTAFSDQLLENGNTSFYFSDKEQRGYINRLDFKVDGITARTEDHPQHIDIIKLLLPKSLAPQQRIVITTPFHVKLPFNFSRGGYAGQSFQITQWFPKPAVYDRKGWHPMPYLDQGEFFSEFGNYDVRITVPEAYTVAATGLNTNVVSEGNTKKYFYQQDSVHDFAWFADTSFRIDKDTVMLQSGRVVNVAAYYSNSVSSTWNNAASYAKDAVRFYSKELGEYPYSTVTVVQGPQSFGGGMEYPTVTVISPVGSKKELDIVIAHEIGHNWFQGILASNEREYPWMDEGLNSFYERKYTERKYGKPTQEEELFFQTIAKRKTDQPIAFASGAFSEINYGLSVYHKTAEWMLLLEKQFGEIAFRNAMRAYYDEWKFRHPYPDDFQASLKSSLGDKANESFLLLHKTGILPGSEFKGFSVVSPFIKGSIRSYVKSPTKDALLISPLIGGNNYDKIMLGALLTNYKLVPNSFQFLLAPFYATGSKRFTGLGKLNYSFTGTGAIRKTDIFVNASSFSMDRFEDTAAKKYFMGFRKLAPGLKLQFRNKDPRSKVSSFVQWKTFFINEESLRVERDTNFIGTDTFPFLRYLFPKKYRYLNQLKFVYENHRELYPFGIELQLEQSTDFIRPALTANYFFNYAEGGLQVRFFAGKFFYLGGYSLRKEFNNDRYLLNMTGAKGYEDYTYSDYFIGRNEFEGFSSQQIMIRDGGFKVRTDLLSSKIGKTDNWLMALNFNTTIPKRLNPLSVLPIKIPLRIFMDIGTYAEAWEKDADVDRILYDIGFHIPLLNESFNLYFPVLYNKEYGDYFKSTIPKNRFFKTMSFSIQLYNKELKKINRELEF